jgi:hypothetical protein
MVQEAGRVRGSEKPPATKGAAARRAANEAHETLRTFASCLVRGAGTSRERADLVAFLQTPLDNPAVHARTDKILRENCIYGTGADSTLLRFSPELLRGAIFRQLYLDRTDSSPAAVSRADVLPAALLEGDLSLSGNQRFGACIVAADAQAAESFVRAKVASAPQEAALRSVMAAMSGCLTQGLTLEMSRAILDGVLSEALYRRVTLGTMSEGSNLDAATRAR